MSPRKKVFGVYSYEDDDHDDFPTALILACSNGGYDFRRKDNEWITVARYSTEKNLKLIRLLLNTPGIDPNMTYHYLDQDVFDQTPLMTAAYEGDLPTLQLLLQHPETSMTMRNRQGESALQLVLDLQDAHLWKQYVPPMLNRITEDKAELLSILRELAYLMDFSSVPGKSTNSASTPSPIMAISSKDWRSFDVMCDEYNVNSGFDLFKALVAIASRGDPMGYHKDITMATLEEGLLAMHDVGDVTVKTMMHVRKKNQVLDVNKRMEPQIPRKYEPYEPFGDDNDRPYGLPPTPELDLIESAAELFKRFMEHEDTDDINPNFEIILDIICSAFSGTAKCVSVRSITVHLDENWRNFREGYKDQYDDEKERLEQVGRDSEYVVTIIGLSAFATSDKKSEETHGHYGAAILICATNEIILFEPMQANAIRGISGYAKILRQVSKDVFAKVTDKTPEDFTASSAKICETSLQSTGGFAEIPIPYLEDCKFGPSTHDIKEHIAYQHTEAQNHFCYMWSIWFIHLFLDTATRGIVKNTHKRASARTIVKRIGARIPLFGYDIMPSIAIIKTYILGVYDAIKEKCPKRFRLNPYEELYFPNKLSADMEQPYQSI